MTNSTKALFFGKQGPVFIGCGSPAVHFSPDFQSGAAIPISLSGSVSHSERSGESSTEE
jgi:hypothetical protein